jgi:cation diffusion facilitator family transporter
VEAAPTGSNMTPQQRTALLSVVAAAALVTLKLVTGLLTGSLGLIAEALHSGTDLVAALLTFLAVRVAGRPPDREHPFGHGKAEHLAALGEASFLVLVSVAIAGQSIYRLAEAQHGHVTAPWYAIAVLLVVMLIDAVRATASWRAARRYESAALASNALHFGSDLLGSTAVLAGLLAVRAGHPAADAIAALIVAVLVVSAAIRLMRQNVNVLMDRSPADAEAAARGAIEAAEPGIDLRRLRVREAGGRYFVDVVVGIKADAAVGQGHAVADALEDAVRRVLPRSDVVVHVEPSLATTDLRERVNGAALTVRGVREIHNVTVTRIDGRDELSLHIKLPPDLSLEDAHAIASEVERAIQTAVPQLSRVHTHIEPLAAPASAERLRGAEGAEAKDAIAAAVREITGRDPLELRVVRGDQGLVGLVTIGLPGSQELGDAHATAAAVKRRVRDEVPDVVEVVVHTEPLEVSPPVGGRPG